MTWFLAWGKYAIVLVYLWMAVAYTLAARRSRVAGWWAAGGGWLVFTFLLWQQYGIHRHQFDPLLWGMILFLILCPLILIVVHLAGKLRTLRYTHARDMLLLRQPQAPAAEPRRARYEALGIVLAALLCVGITLVSLTLRPCHALDRAFAISGCRQVLKTEQHLQDLAFSQDGHYLAAASDQINVWQSNTGQQIATLPASVEAKALAFAPDHQSFAIGGYNEIVELRSIATSTVERTFAITGTVESLAFSPDGQLLSAGTPGEITIWNVADGKLLHQLPVNQDVYSLVFAPNGRWMASGGLDGQVTVWSVPDFSVLHTLSSNTTYQLAFSPDSQWLAAAQFGERVTVWRTSDYQQAWWFSGPPIERLPQDTEEPSQEQMRSVAYTPDSTYLVSGSSSGTLHIWQATNGQPLSTLQFDDQVHDVAVAPDGQTLAIGLWDNTVRLWRWSMVEPAQASAISPAP